MQLRRKPQRISRRPLFSPSPTRPSPRQWRNPLPQPLAKCSRPPRVPSHQTGWGFNSALAHPHPPLGCSRLPRTLLHRTGERWFNSALGAKAPRTPTAPAATTDVDSAEHKQQPKRRSSIKQTALMWIWRLQLKCRSNHHSHLCPCLPPTPLCPCPKSTPHLPAPPTALAATTDVDSAEHKQQPKRRSSIKQTTLMWIWRLQLKYRSNHHPLLCL
jgi:hypothetical protein